MLLYWRLTRGEEDSVAVLLMPRVHLIHSFILTGERQCQYWVNTRSAVGVLVYSNLLEIGTVSVAVLSVAADMVIYLDWLERDSVRTEQTATVQLTDWLERDSVSTEQTATVQLTDWRETVSVLSRQPQCSWHGNLFRLERGSVSTEWTATMRLICSFIWTERESVTVSVEWKATVQLTCWFTEVDHGETRPVLGIAIDILIYFDWGGGGGGGQREGQTDRDRECCFPSLLLPPSLSLSVSLPVSPSGLKY